MVLFQNCLIVSVLVLSVISLTYGGECNCHCNIFRNQHVCENIEHLWRVSTTNTEKLLEWERYRPFIERFRDRWKKEISDIVEMKIEEYIAEGRFYPKPENLVIEAEDGIQSDSPFTISKPPAEDSKNIVSDLLVKVELMENRTTEVEEELKSERRVRRDLEKEVKETKSSLTFLGDQLQNVTVPVDAMMDQVQMVIYSSLEDMNKTIYEEHLKKLYYRVDGVVYKNETKKLDERLEHVEIELHDVGNSSIVSKLAEDLKTLEENLNLLNNSIEDTLVQRIEIVNNSIGNVLIPRIQTLETNTVQKNVTEDLENRMTNLLNNTELFRSTLADVWSDIHDIQNFEQKFQDFTEQWSASLEELQSQVEFLKNESLLSKFREPPDESYDQISQMHLIGDDVTDNDAIFHVAKTTGQSGFTTYTESSTIPWQGDETWNPPNVVDRLNILENGTVDYEKEYSTWATPFIVNRSKIEDDGTTEYQYATTLLPDITPSNVERGRIDVDSNEIYEYCDKPHIKDPHLLVDLVTDSDGRSQLKFGCRPIGLYAVSYLPVPPGCKEGSWKGPFPSCYKLSTMTEIDDLNGDLLEKHQCLLGIVEIPDPTNCSRFFKCAHGKLSVMRCPTGLHFNAKLKVCDYPRMAACTDSESVLYEKLQTLMPPILISPDNVDAPSSHLGTGSAGQLIVHRRSSFTLHCLYPKTDWGNPTWNVTYTDSAGNSRHLTIEEGNNRISLSVTVAMEEDTGIYRCVTPFGVQHAIEVVVKEVVCPEFYMEEEYEDVYYRPTPEGEVRIMGSRAEFHCENGSRIFAQCMANGSWSREIPSDDECILKKRKSRNGWKCKPLDISGIPGLIPEQDDEEKVIRFRCVEGKSLIGNTLTRCRDDGVWSHPSPPKCKT